jgi:hypothetical protein
MTRIIVRIERLVLRGVARGDEQTVAAAMRAAVADQLRIAVPPARCMDMASLNAGVIRTGTGTTATQLGAKAGRAIAGRLVRR